MRDDDEKKIKTWPRPDCFTKTNVGAIIRQLPGIDYELDLVVNFPLLTMREYDSD